MDYLPSKLMIVAPHPDDAEIGVGGTIARWIRAGAEAVLVLCTNGDKGSSDPEMTSERLAAIREKEQMEAATVLGIQHVLFLRYPDGELEDCKQFRGDLVREIRRHKPEAVMTVDPHRQTGYLHRDHRVTGQVTIDAVFPYARDHLSFPEHKAMGLTPHKVRYLYLWGSETPDHWMDISETIDLKIEALAKHVSQFGGRTGRDFRTFMKENARRAAGERGMEYAEAFRVIEHWR